MNQYQTVTYCYLLKPKGHVPLFRYGLHISRNPNTVTAVSYSRLKGARMTTDVQVELQRTALVGSRPSTLSVPMPLVR